MLDLLRQGLYEHGYTVMTAADGVTGLEIASSYQFDAIVLDIGLPQLDGYAVIEQLRARSHSIPVLMLTARDAEDDIIRGLDIGADDYLTKPFSFPELVLRLQSITRPFRSEHEGLMEVGDVTIDRVRRSVIRDNHRIDLTRHEYLLFVALLRRAGQCVSRQQLIESIWGQNHTTASSALDVLVNSLRAKIDGPFQTRLIWTVRGSGYFLRDRADLPEGIES
jgi:DNA-binding response OmpR family regulator